MVNLVQEVNILDIFNAEWQNATALLNFKGKKEQLEELANTCKGKSIVPGDFGPLTNFLKVQISQHNVPLS